MRKRWREKKWLVKGLVMICIVAGSLTGCGASANKMGDTIASEEYIQENAYDEIAYASEAEAEAPSSEAMPNIDTSSTYNRKVIKSGNMRIQTKTFSETVKEIIESLKEVKGYVESMNMAGIDYYRNDDSLQSAELNVRIPQEAFDSFINNGDSFGNVTELSCSTEDITSQYVDTQMHLEVLKTRYDRLLALMKEVDDYESIFKFEKEIADVEYEINSYQGTLNEYDSVVNMSTIRIVVQEVSEYTKEPVKPVTLGDQLKQGLADSWHSVVNFFRGILILFVCFVPFLLIIAPMLLVIYLIYRKNKKQNKKKDEQLQAKSDEEHKDE